MTHTLLLVDDEPNVLSALRRLFERAGHRVLLAGSGEEGLRTLRSEPVSLVISDQRMPGMQGSDFLVAARELQPEAVRIMLTGFSDLQAAIKAINEGHVYRFLLKPWDNQGLLDTVGQALRDLEIRREHALLQDQIRQKGEELEALNRSLERKVLERTNEIQMALDYSEQVNRDLRQKNLGVVRSMAGLLDLRSPAIGAHARRVSSLVPPLCARLGVGDRDAVQGLVVAALLHDLGKIGLSDALLMKEPAHLGSAEREDLSKHPIVGEGHLQVLEGMGDTAAAVRSHHENVDGSGYPDGRRGEDIPLGARILRVLDAYDNLTKGGARRGAERTLVLQSMDRMVSRHFDGEVFNALLGALGDREDAYDASREIKVSLGSLKEGMVLVRDLMTRSGVLLVAKGETLRRSHLDRISNFRQIYPTDDCAFVARTG